MLAITACQDACASLFVAITPTTIQTDLFLQIRKTLFDMMDMPTGYGVDIGDAVAAISSLRGNVSAMASMTDPPTYADEGFETDGLQTIVPSGGYNIAFSRTPMEVLAIVYLGSASAPGGFFPNGFNGNVK